jgi:hypothetical protein
LLKVPDMWVFDMHRLTFFHRAVRGKPTGTYRPELRSRAFAVLMAAEVLERLDDPVFCRGTGLGLRCVGA